MDLSLLDKLTPENIPLDFVKQYLRVDYDFDDLEIALALKASVAYVKKYIKKEDKVLEDKDLIIPILVLVSHFYENKSLNAKSSEKIDSIISSILDMNRVDIL